MIDDRELIEREFLLLALANANYYGDGFKVAPDALLNDGYMNLCLVDKVSRMEFIKLVAKYKVGYHVNESGESLYPFIRYQKCKKVLIESYKPLGICADGEISPYKSVQIEIAHEAVSFSVPKGARCLSLSDKAEKEHAAV